VDFGRVLAPVTGVDPGRRIPSNALPELQRVSACKKVIDLEDEFFLGNISDYEKAFEGESDRSVLEAMRSEFEERSATIAQATTAFEKAERLAALDATASACFSIGFKKRGNKYSKVPIDWVLGQESPQSFYLAEKHGSAKPSDWAANFCNAAINMADGEGKPLASKALRDQLVDYIAEVKVADRKYQELRKKSSEGAARRLAEMLQFIESTQSSEPKSNCICRCSFDVKITVPASTRGEFTIGCADLGERWGCKYPSHFKTGNKVGTRLWRKECP